MEFFTIWLAKMLARLSFLRMNNASCSVNATLRREIRRLRNLELNYARRLLDVYNVPINSQGRRRLELPGASIIQRRRGRNWTTSVTLAGDLSDVPELTFAGSIDDLPLPAIQSRGREAHVCIAVAVLRLLQARVQRITALKTESGRV
jgi:hypothetical protein